MAFMASVPGSIDVRNVRLCLTCCLDWTMGIPITDLTRKLGLLKSFGGFGSMNGLAEEFGVSETTLYGWGSGRSDRANEDRLPDRHVPKLLEIAARCLGDGYSPERIRELVFAPFGDFETALRAAGQTGLHRFIEAEGRRGLIKLIPAPVAGLAETDDEDTPDPENSIGLDQWFRLEVTTPIRSPHAFTLQNAGRRWGVYPSLVDLGRGVVLVPGKKRTGEVGNIRERVQTGPHRFVVMQCPSPPPQDVMTYFRESVELDMAALRRVAAFYAEQNANRRALFVTDIEVVGHSSDASR